MSPRVYLVGMMGAGKTTVGRKLAKFLGWEFVDLDQQVERSTGVTVATIFEIEGEAGFRQREASALAQAARAVNSVIATGGGVVLAPMNRARLAASGYVVYLHALPEQLYARTKHDRNRPLLQVADPLARLRKLAEQRDPLYREAADCVVESGIDPNNTVNCILKAIADNDHA